MADAPRRARADDDDPAVHSRNQWAKAGVAMGIGSAALVAALLYAGRRKPDEKPRPRDDFMD